MASKNCMLLIVDLDESVLSQGDRIYFLKVQGPVSQKTEVASLGQSQ